MNQHKKLTRMPRYMKDFHCIGPKCEDNCCIGWDVDIDKQTFKKYQQVKDGELTRMFKKYLYRNEYCFSDDIDFAGVELTKHKYCPFLNEKKLCRIQYKLGEDYLSNVCATFPRIINKLNGVFEISVNISCPEAARLILLNPAGIEFLEEEGFNNRNMINDEFETKDDKKGHDPSRYLKELREFALKVLRDRHYLLWERLLILGYFFEEVKQSIDNKRTDHIPMVLKTYESKLETDYFKKRFYQSSVEYSFQMTLNKELVDKLKVFSEIDSRQYIEFTKQCLSGIGTIQDKTAGNKGQEYEAAIQKFYAPFMKEHEYILENYLVNLVFKNLFPFSETEKPYDAYIILAVRFAIIRFYLIGLGAYHKGLTKELTVQFIQSFSKTVEHHKTYLGRILGYLKKKKWNTTDYMAMLLKEEH